MPRIVIAPEWTTARWIAPPGRFAFHERRSPHTDDALDGFGARSLAGSNVNATAAGS